MRAADAGPRTHNPVGERTGRSPGRRQDGPRYGYSTQPTGTKLAEDRAELLKSEPDKVAQELGIGLRSDLRCTDDFPRVHPCRAPGRTCPTIRSHGDRERPDVEVQEPGVREGVGGWNAARERVSTAAISLRGDVERRAQREERRDPGGRGPGGK